MADRYWVGDGGNWSDNAAHWAAASDAAPGASKPTSSDNVFFDAESFDNPGQTVTLDETARCLDMDWTGVTDTPALAYNSQTLWVYDSLTFISAMTASGAGALYFTGAVTHSFTFAGISTPGFGTALYSGTLSLIDTAVIAGGFTLNAGILLTNNQTLSCGLLTVAGATAKTVTLGSSVVNCTAWNMANGGGAVTLTANTATIKVAGTGVFAGNSLTTYNNVELNGTAHTISGDNTFASLTFKADTTQTITFTDGTTQTVTTPTITGSSGKVKTLVGSATSGWTITKVGGGTVTADYLDISYSEGRPQRTWIAGIHSTDTILNTGWLFGRDWSERSGAGWWVIKH